MPSPRRLERGGATKSPAVGANRVVGHASPRLHRAAARLPAMGLALRFEVGPTPDAVPRLADGDAGYSIDLADVVTVRAPSDWGAIQALATLAQLEGEQHDCVRIEDEPAYPWRGLMIDVARHFIGVAALRRTLDAMAFYRLNVLHLHLTDDQAFRFRSEAWPELASADAFDAAELAGLVSYAADRAIRVVPELDVPGHVTSVLAVHPEWGAGDAPAASRRFGVHDTCLDPANPAALEAVRTLLAELAAVFPDECLHFGGDEVSGRWWRDHPPVQALMARQRLDDARDVQAFFNRSVTAAVADLGRRPVAWDEALHPGLDRRVVIQAWRGVSCRDSAVAAGFDCVLSAPYYLDFFYPAVLHYGFDPAGDAGAASRRVLEDDRTRHVRDGLEWMAGLADVPALPPSGRPGRVLGGEACLWSELVDANCLDTRLWSRMPAIAERFWNGASADGAGLAVRTAASRRILARQHGIATDAQATLGILPGLERLVEMLEPVKWYRRLLGPVYENRVSGLGESADARPYDADTPLDRPVDFLPPESSASRRAEADLAAGRDMKEWVEGWREQHAAVSHRGLDEDLYRASAALARLAEIVAGEAPPGDGDDLAGPFGEYLLPVAYAVARHR